MNVLNGTSMKLIAGYPSARDYVLAVERGETDGGTSTFIGLSQLYASYIKDKKLNILVQFSTTRDPAMPDVPTIMEITKDPEARQIFQQLISNDEIGRALFTTPNVPADRLALLRTAFQEMVNDPDFKAEADRLQLPLSPKSGEDLQTLVSDMFKLSPETLAKLKDLMK